MGLFLLNGKGAWMVSGYNAMSAKEQALYDELALCRYAGKMMIAMGAGMALMGVATFDDEFRAVPFYIGLAVTVVVGIGGSIPMFTLKRFLKPHVTAGELVAAQAARPRSKLRTMLIIAVTAVTLAGMAVLFVMGEREPVVTVGAESVHISGWYGTTIAHADISGIELVEQTMRGIGAGMRRNGYAMGSTLKGHFTAGLVFADASAAPTLRITRANASNIYISFTNPEATRALYNELTALNLQ